MNAHRQALSLLEVVISLSLFGLVLASVLQAMISTTQYVDFDTSRNNQETESTRLQNQIINDFANAAWFYKFDTLTMCLKINEDTKQPVKKYPKVYLDGTAIEFLKLRTSTVINSDPKKQRYAYTNFRGNSTEPVAFSRYIDALPSPLMVLNPKYESDPAWYVAPVWEAMKSLDFFENQDPGYLRHYVYMVTKNARGSKSLVRAYHNYEGITLPETADFQPVMPDFSTWTVDEVLIDEVKEVRFSTFREDPTLKGNQVRFEVELEHEGQGLSASTGVKLLRKIDFVVAMRSIIQEN